jgi:hypothetical protein
MKRVVQHWSRRFRCLGFGLLALIGGSAGVSAQDENSRVGLEAALEMRHVLGDMPMLRGNQWQKMGRDEKMAFVGGMGHVVSIENELMSRFPELMEENFSNKVSKALLGKTANDIIARLDSFYQQNPDKLAQPVMAVLWDTMVRPKLKTGIAGHPLK